MKSALITITLIVATAFQPLLAVPNLCRMPGADNVTCASCCAVRRCCAAAEQRERAPVAAVRPASPDVFVAEVPAVVVITTLFAPDREFLGLMQLASFSHGPLPRMMSCIQLI